LDQQNRYKQREDVLYSELKGKSRQAFEYLYDNYSPALYGVILNILRDEESSNDALQEVFVKIWNNFDSPSRSMTAGCQGVDSMTESIGCAWRTVRDRTSGSGSLTGTDVGFSACSGSRELELPVGDRCGFNLMIGSGRHCLLKI